MSDDLQNICLHIFNQINIKELFFMYILYIIISSNMFQIYMIKEKYNNTFIQGIYFIIIYAILDIFIKLNML